MSPARYQNGSLVLSDGKWRFRYYQHDMHGKPVRKSVLLGTLRRFPTRTKARKAMADRMREINEAVPVSHFSDLCDAYERKAMPERKDTRAAYGSFIRRLRDGLGAKRIDWIASPEGIAFMEQWFAGLLNHHGKQSGRPLAWKSKLLLKAFLHSMFEHAPRWGFLAMTVRNPVELVHLKRPNPSESGKRKRVLLTLEQYRALLADSLLPDYVKVLIQTAAYTGFGISEVLGLKWDDLDFRSLRIQVRRGYVAGQANDTKTPCRSGSYPIHPELARVLRRWQREVPAVADNWVFGSHHTGRPFAGTMIQQRYLVPAGERLGIIPGPGVMGLGFHNFRHLYRSLARETGAAPEAQKKLMRHSRFTTTFDVYGNDDDRRAEEIRPENTLIGNKLRRKA